MELRVERIGLMNSLYRDKSKRQAREKFNSNKSNIVSKAINKLGITNEKTFQGILDVCMKSK